MRMMFAVSLLLLGAAAQSAAQQTDQSDLPPGWVMPAGLVPEPRVLRRLVNASDGVVKGDGEGHDGLYPELGNNITGAGWISLGPGYRHHVLNGQALVDLSATVSWRLYQTVQARFELPHVAHERLSLGVQGMYQDLLQVNYFGLGDESLESDRSGYRLNDIDVLGYGTVRATTWLSVGGRFGWIRRPHLSTVTGRRVTFPNTLDLFSESSAPGIDVQPAFLYSEASLVADSRDHPGHPTRGGLYRATAASYSDRDADMFSFRRYEVEASQFIPLFTRKWILALHGWEVFSDTSSSNVVPFYLMPSLGGQNTLRGYSDYRFHDNNMQLLNAESRWALFTHVDAAVFADAGKVTPRAGDLDFRHLKKSYGVGLRVHNVSSTLARLDVGHSTEGWRLFLKLTDSFKRSTPAAGRSDVVPFVP
jgi:hypothetical protein